MGLNKLHSQNIIFFVMDVTWPRVVIGVAAVVAVLIARKIRSKTPNFTRDVQFLYQLATIKKRLLK